MESEETGYNLKTWLRQLFSPEVFTNLSSLAEHEMGRAQLHTEKIAADAAQKGKKRKAEGVLGDYPLELHLIDVID